MSQALTVQEVADLESVHHTTIRAEIGAGRLKARRVGNGRRSAIRIDSSDYAAWKEARMIVPTRKPSPPRQRDTFNVQLKALKGGAA